MWLGIAVADLVMLAAFVLFALFVVTQLVVPLLQGTPLFPRFRRSTTHSGGQP